MLSMVPKVSFMEMTRKVAYKKNIGLLEPEYGVYKGTGNLSSR